MEGMFGVLVWDLSLWTLQSLITFSRISTLQGFVWWPWTGRSISNHSAQQSPS